jgi:hypothetical protein
MSGLLGVGSKSGVIGTTELDYEEGTWTASLTGDGGIASQSLVYTKTGRTVFLHGTLTFTSATGSTILMSGMPFTPTAAMYTMLVSSKADICLEMRTDGQIRINTATTTSWQTATQMASKSISINAFYYI